MKKLILPIALLSISMATAASAASSAAPTLLNVANNTYRMLLVTITDSATENPLPPILSTINMMGSQSYPNSTVTALPAAYTVSWCWSENSNATVCDPIYPAMSCPAASSNVSSVVVSGSKGLIGKIGPFWPLTFTCSYSK